MPNHCPPEKALGPKLPIQRTAKTLVAQADLRLRWAHMPFCWFCQAPAQNFSGRVLFRFEPRHKKTSLLDFGSGMTQTGLLSYRS